MKNQYTRLAAACRRFKFEAVKSLGVFWLAERIGLEVKKPYKTLYRRTK